MCRGIQKSLAIDTRLFPMALKCTQVEYECCLDDHRFCQINVGKCRVDLLPNDWMAINCANLLRFDLIYFGRIRHHLSGKDIVRGDVYE